MDLFSREDLRVLLKHTQTSGASFLKRTTRGVHNQDKMRWKDQLREATELLTGLGWRTGDSDNLLRPAQESLDDVPFWLGVSGGPASSAPTDCRWPSTIRSS
jgi:hypothetical protein